jgi:hypothetical protein
MRRAAILLAVVILASQAAAVGLGFTVSPRLLFPLHDPYIDGGTWERGVMLGFGFSFDISLFPGLTAGPYFGGLFPLDTYPLQGSEGDGKVFWTDLVVGARFKYSVPTGGPWRPWLSVAPGYGILSATARAEYYGITYETDYDNTGGFGLDAGLGVDYRISETFFVGFGIDFHLNTADMLKYEINGDRRDWELEESPVGFGFGFNAGIDL